MTAQEQFRQFVSEIGTALHIHGFRRLGTRLGWRRDGCWGVIAFQRSRKSSASAVRFTINVGIAADLLFAFEQMPVPQRVPSDPVCHWRARIGWLTPDQRDVWWVLAPPPQSRDVADFTAMLEAHVVPFLSRYASNEGLRDLLLENRPCLISPRAENTLCLLRIFGPSATYDAAARTLRENWSKKFGAQSPIDQFLTRLDQFARSHAQSPDA